ncbi:hypothetical protein DPMN_029637 [Dreissena polymorpha]|uniref:Uncharacterized protein n=1 Tax=Dreissena polymorpha TaxID=45954 RepID=A0A9D4RFG0_DREPO|nr:hypothetical protein DPMN_029637 [Dreissena polymorpha]
MKQRLTFARSCSSKVSSRKPQARHYAVVRGREMTHRDQVNLGKPDARRQMRGITATYTELPEDCNQRDWRNWLFPIEVGARRLSAQSVCRLMLAVELTGRNRRQTIRKPRKVP